MSPTANARLVVGDIAEQESDQESEYESEEDDEDEDS